MSSEIERRNEVAFDVGKTIQVNKKHNVTAETVKEIRSAREQGFTYREISELLGVGSETICKALNNPEYLTKVKKRKYTSEADYQKVRELRLKGYQRPEIAKLTDLSEGTVSGILKEIGLPFHKVHKRNKQQPNQDKSANMATIPRNKEIALLSSGIQILQNLNVRELQTTTAKQLGYALAMLETALQFMQEG